MTVERGKIREFARATGSTSAEYFEDPDPVIPPTFLRTAAFWEPDDLVSPFADLDLDASRCLHGEQEYEFFGVPPRAGTTLIVKSRLESVVEKQGRRGGSMRIVVVVEDFSDENGTLVARGRMTAIETGKVPA